MSNSNIHTFGGPLNRNSSQSFGCFSGNGQALGGGSGAGQIFNQNCRNPLAADAEDRAAQVPSDQAARAAQVPSDQAARAAQVPSDQAARAAQVPSDQAARAAQVPPDQAAQEARAQALAQALAQARAQARAEALAEFQAGEQRARAARAAQAADEAGVAKQRARVQRGLADLAAQAAQRAEAVADLADQAALEAQWVLTDGKRKATVELAAKAADEAAKAAKAAAEAEAKAVVPLGDEVYEVLGSDLEGEFYRIWLQQLRTDSKKAAKAAKAAREAAGRAAQAALKARTAKPVHSLGNFEGLTEFQNYYLEKTNELYLKVKGMSKDEQEQFLYTFKHDVCFDKVRGFRDPELSSIVSLYGPNFYRCVIAFLEIEEESEMDEWTKDVLAKCRGLLKK